MTTPLGWIEFGGERHDLRVEASATDRGATYYLDSEPRWWSEVEWLDQWFEELWMEAAEKPDTTSATRSTSAHV